MTTSSRQARPSWAITTAAAVTMTAAATLHAADVTAHFSPHGDAAAATRAAIDAATTTIDIAVYYLTDPGLTTTTIAARRRGCSVRIIVDASQEAPGHNELDKLQNAGCTVKTDRTEKLFHNKYAIIDTTTTIVGSFNWTANAERKNAESLVVIHDTNTAAAFAADFQQHWEHSAPYRLRRANLEPLPATRRHHSPPLRPHLERSP